MRDIERESESGSETRGKRKDWVLERSRRRREGRGEIGFLREREEKRGKRREGREEIGF